MGAVGFFYDGELPLRNSLLLTPFLLPDSIFYNIFVDYSEKCFAYSPLVSPNFLTAATLCFISSIQFSVSLFQYHVYFLISRVSGFFPLNCLYLTFGSYSLISSRFFPFYPLLYFSLLVSNQQLLFALGSDHQE